MSTDLQKEFASPKGLSKSELDSAELFSPKFDDQELISVVTADADDGTILMVAYMNEEALRTTIDTGIATYWSRSRGKLWKKGETSGSEQKIVEIRTDCDQDVILLRVRTQGTGANCHTGRKSCFYRTIKKSDDGNYALVFDAEDTPRFDPDKVYS